MYVLFSVNMTALQLVVSSCTDMRIYFTCRIVTELAVSLQVGELEDCLHLQVPLTTSPEFSVMVFFGFIISSRATLRLVVCTVKPMMKIDLSFEGGDLL